MHGMKQNISKVFEAFGVSGIMSTDAKKRMIACHAHGNVKLQFG